MCFHVPKKTVYMMECPQGKKVSVFVLFRVLAWQLEGGDGLWRNIRFCMRAGVI